MLEADDLLLKVNLYNLSQCESFMNNLLLSTKLKLLINEQIGENFAVTLDDLIFEKIIYNCLESVRDKFFDDKINCKLENLIVEIKNDKLLKIPQTSTLHSSWSSLVNFFIKQWDNKIKKMILNHFKVTNSIDHLTDLEKVNIKLLGRTGHDINPYLILIGKMKSICDGFDSNKRISKTYIFHVLELSYSRLRIRGDNTSVAEMIKDNFSYRLSLKDDYSLPSNIFDINCTTSELHSSHKGVTLPIFGNKNEIISYPLFLVLLIDRMTRVQCIDGTTVTVRSDKDFSFPEYITGEDFNVADSSRLSYCLLAAQTCRGNVYFRSDGCWIKRRNHSFIKSSEKEFEKCFTNEGVEVLIYMRNIF